MCAETAPELGLAEVLPIAVAPDQEHGWLDDAALADLLRHAARSDLDAFMTFYDATCTLAWRLELRRTRSRDQAERATYRRFVSAWRHAAGYPSSGLSARAWLLSLPVDAEAYA